MKKSRSTGLRAVLLQRDMIRIFVASFFILGQVLVSFSLVPLYIAERGGDTFAVGLQTTIFALASVVLRFYFGPLADTRGRRFTLALGAFVFATANVAILYAPNLLVMGVARIYQAVGMAAYLSSASSLVADLAPPEFRGSAIGAYRVIMPVASLVGPFLGNDLINRYGFPVFFWTMAAVSTISLGLVLNLKAGRLLASSVPAKITVADILALFRIRNLRAAYAAILGISIGGGIVNTFITTYGVPYFNNPAIYFVVYAAAGAVSAILLGRLSDRYGRISMIVPIFFCIAAGIFVLRYIDYAPTFLYLLSAVCTGIGFNAGLSVFISWVVDSSRFEVRATALSLQESWIDSGFAVGIFLFGTLSARFGMSRVFCGTGVVLFLWTGIVLTMAGEEKRKVNYEHST